MMMGLELQQKLGQFREKDFHLFKVLRAHILPLTNVAFNKSGSWYVLQLKVLLYTLSFPPFPLSPPLPLPSPLSFITGSYDRTCKVWDTNAGEELFTLEGHRNVVYAIAFNNPYGSVCLSVNF